MALMAVCSFYICSLKAVMRNCHAKRQFELFCLQARVSPCLRLAVYRGVHSVCHFSSAQAHSAPGKVLNTTCDLWGVTNRVHGAGSNMVAFRASCLSWVDKRQGFFSQGICQTQNATFVLLPFSLFSSRILAVCQLFLLHLFI